MLNQEFLYVDEKFLHFQKFLQVQVHSFILVHNTVLMALQEKSFQTFLSKICEINHTPFWQSSDSSLAFICGLWAQGCIQMDHKMALFYKH